MEYFELGDLRTYLDRKPPLPEHEAKEINSITKEQFAI